MKLLISFMVAFILVIDKSEAQYINAGHWQDRSGQHRTTQQWNSDYDECEAQAKTKFALSSQPGPPGNYYAPAMKYVKQVHDYVVFKCMPKKNWFWITDAVLPLSP